MIELGYALVIGLPLLVFIVMVWPRDHGESTPDHLAEMQKNPWWEDSHRDGRRWDGRRWDGRK
ncbi:hypothetical protein [Nocardia aurea]|uniref:hypothetical protein n=1 Tax=Nocardia aurea TaxID=2144174 RepID=UPI0013002E82|nr:hypothetical protein [Nocardia aurea]